MSQFDWYVKAKAKLEQFLPALDPDLEVDVDTDVITPADGSPEYETFLLTFSHPHNAKLQWTMELRMDAEYLEHELETTVRKIYFARVE
ncbi:MAG: hypothetical protein FJ316_08410 [SAR202 cluster bacterium]|nr:hypothetical protein [SAR202 cluster bacterium]